MTSTVKHTPAPWEVGNTSKGEDAAMVYSAASGTHFDGIRVADCNTALFLRKEESFANAKLIAAAPDLLEALKKITDKSPYAEDRGTEYCLFCSMRDWQPHADDCPFILGKAALSKATGEQS